jgi:hypothetical protein
MAQRRQPPQFDSISARKLVSYDRMRDAVSERDWQYPCADVATSRTREGSTMDDKISLPFLTQWTISPVPQPTLVTVVETPEFLAATRKLMDVEERALLVDHLALNPMAGDLIRAPAVSASCVGVWMDGASAVGRG